MELAAAVFTSIGAAVGGTAAAAGTAAAGTATTAAGSLFGGSFLSTVLQGGVGLMGAMAAMREGQEKSAALQAQAEDANFNASQANLAGMQKSDQLRRALLAQQGERDAAAAASGIDLSFGTPAIAREQAADDTARALGFNADNTDITRSRYLQQADQYRRMAGSARQGGLLKAFGQVASTGLSIAKRG